MKARKALFWCAFVIVLGVFVFSGYKIVSYMLEAEKSDGAVDTLIKKAVTKTEIKNTDDPGKPTEKAEYAPIQVDFEQLKSESPEIVGWLFCEDTVIDYPIMQTDNNSYYLNHLYNGKKNANGSLFMDYRNTCDFYDLNNVVYGHNMNSGKMFGSFMKYKKQEYFDEHPVFYLLTPQGDYRIEIVAGMVTDPDSEIYEIPNDREGRDRLVRFAMDKSTFVSGVEVSGEDRLITMSTCSYEHRDARYVLLGRLVELARQQD
ncbi:MAG: class B sortase [Clostridia bacterium]|nr:class B sortase [Clostridia bacterium]